MGWEGRGCGRFYYLKIRDGSHVRSCYIGRDPEAPRRADLLRPETRISRRQLALTASMSEEPLRTYCSDVEQVLRCALEAAGYHRHRRGEWRRRRVTASGVKDLLPEARTDPCANRELWRQLDEDGVSAQFVRLLTDTAAGLLSSAVSGLVDQEAYRRKLAEMRVQLGAATAPPLDLLLIDRIVVCWLALDRAERRLHSLKAGSSAATVDFHASIVDRAQKRFLSAVRSLAVVRRLAVPAIQVNIGERQMNLVGSGHQGPGVGRMDRVLEG